MSTNCVCVCEQMKTFHQTETLLSGCCSPYSKVGVTCPCHVVMAGLTEDSHTTQRHVQMHSNRGLMTFPVHCDLYFLPAKVCVMINPITVSMTTSLPVQGELLETGYTTQINHKPAVSQGDSTITPDGSIASFQERSLPSCLRRNLLLRYRRGLWRKKKKKKVG